MQLAASILVGLVALLHFGFLLLEMFYWDKPLGLRVFRMNAEKAAQSRVLAANQGLYNGFLGAGLVWSFFLPQAEALHVQLFFLGCIVVAGIFAMITVNRKPLYVQGIPAALAMLALWLA